MRIKNFLWLLLLGAIHPLFAISLGHVKHYLPQNPVILEAGAFDGRDTDYLSSYCSKGMIHVFEPIPHYFQDLRKKFRQKWNVKIYPYALNTFSGKTNLYLNAVKPATSSLLEAIEYDCETPIPIECITLKDWIERNDIRKIDFMWLNLEGMEYQVLASYEKVLKNLSCLIVKTNYTATRQGMSLAGQLETLLKKHGFVNTYSEGSSDRKDLVWVKKELWKARQKKKGG